MNPDRPRSKEFPEIRADLKGHARAEQADDVRESVRSRRIQETLDRMRLRAEAKRPEDTRSGYV